MMFSFTFYSISSTNFLYSAFKFSYGAFKFSYGAFKFSYGASRLSSQGLGLKQGFEEPLAGVLEEFEGELEVAIRAVVGIWDGLLAWVMTQIVAHADDLLKI